MAIDDFRFKYRWLSNFHLVSIDYEGIVYPSTEHAYQAAKTLDVELRKKIAALEKPVQAKKLGAKIPLRDDWESIKLGVMETVLRKKFQDPELKQKLLDTGNEELIEGNWWGDTFWGICKGVGENHLGKLLMKIRSEL